jgi:hypothetical protein
LNLPGGVGNPVIHVQPPETPELNRPEKVKVPGGGVKPPAHKRLTGFQEVNTLIALSVSYTGQSRWI